MRILVLSHMFPKPYEEISGLFVLQQTKALAALGCAAEVISPIPWFPPLPRWIDSRWAHIGRTPRSMDYHGVHVVYPQYVAFPKGAFFSTSGLRMELPVRQAILKLRRAFEFDLIHAHTAVPDGAAVVRTARRLGYPLIITIHGQDIHETIFSSARARREVRSVLSAADRVIFVSRSLCKQAEEQLGYLPNAMVIHNGADTSTVAMTPRTDKPKHTSSILTVASLTKCKGVDIAIRAVTELVKAGYPIRYFIVGDGPERKSLQELARGLGIDNCTEFLGEEPHDDVLRLMVSCDIFCLPSYREGFGIVYAEAMALGKPVIGCKGQGIADFVENGNTGFLVEPRCSRDLTRVLRWLLDHPDEARKIGRRAQMLASKKLTWEANARRILQVYREVIHDKKSSTYHDRSSS